MPVTITPQTKEIRQKRREKMKLRKGAEHTKSYSRTGQWNEKRAIQISLNCPLYKMWYEGRDSNSHRLPRQILSLVRLPVPPPSHITKCISLCCWLLCAATTRAIIAECALAVNRFFVLCSFLCPSKSCIQAPYKTKTHWVNTLRKRHNNLLHKKISFTMAYVEILRKMIQNLGEHKILPQVYTHYRSHIVFIYFQEKIS